MSSTFQKVGVMMVLLLGLTFSSGTNWVWADEPKKEGAGDVQERAVPRLGQTPGVFVGSCQCYDGRGTCQEKPKGTCVKGNFQPCSGTCKMTKPEGSFGGGGITIK
jgi:hypothetical protein